MPPVLDTCVAIESFIIITIDNKGTACTENTNCTTDKQRLPLGGVLHKVIHNYTLKQSSAE